MPPLGLSPFPPLLLSFNGPVGFGFGFEVVVVVGGDLPLRMEGGEVGLLGFLVLWRTW